MSPRTPAHKLVNSTYCPIPISTAHVDYTGGVCLWRQRRQLFATVAVKVTFTLVPGATMKLCAPLPIENNESNLPNALGIEPGDLAPCLMQPEIWVRGHAWHPPAEGAPSVRVRLAVARGPELVVRKSVEIPIQQSPFVPPNLHALAPLSRKWPIRTRLLGAFDWANLDHLPIELPDAFDWAYYQAAPADQRLGPLRGDEWIRLEAIHASIHKFDTQLPSASCSIKLFGQVDPFRQGVAIRSGLDTIQIDADRGTCSLVFRGHTPLPIDVALEDLQFVAGIGLPGRPIPNLEPQKPNPPSASFNDTFALDPSILQAFIEPKALPFQEGSSSLSTPPSSPEPAQYKGDAGQTFVPDEQFLQALSQLEALPFRHGAPVRELPKLQSPDKPPHVSSQVIPPPAAVPAVTPLAEQIASTFMLSDEMLAQLVESPTTPFTGGIPLPPRDDPPDALAGLPFKPAPANTQASGKLGTCFLAAMEDAMRAGETHLRMTA